MAMATFCCCNPSCSVDFLRARSELSWKSGLYRESKSSPALFIARGNSKLRRAGEARVTWRVKGRAPAVLRTYAQSAAEVSVSTVEPSVSTEEEPSVSTSEPSVATAEAAVSTAGASPYEVKYTNGGAGDDWENGRSADGKGWLDAAGNYDQRLVAKFRRLAIVAGDRVEMHQVLARQRDNWNLLFHSTIVISAASAAFSAAMSGAEPVLGLSVVAVILNFACGALMALLNQQQPSQLAEEQRRAARFFRRLFVEVEQTLEIEPRMREEAFSYWEEQVGNLHALDADFPLPLTPQGRKKFPKIIMPAKLSKQVSEVSKNFQNPETNQTSESEKYVAHTNRLVKELGSDVKRHIKWAGKVKRVNFAMARVSAILALAAGVFCIIPVTPVAGLLAGFRWLPAVLTVAALFTHSVAHALQLGSGFEMYRNYAGYYREIEIALSKVLRVSDDKRQDWGLLLHDVSLRLGLDPNKIGEPFSSTMRKLF